MKQERLKVRGRWLGEVGEGDRAGKGDGLDDAEVRDCVEGSNERVVLRMLGCLVMGER